MISTRCEHCGHPFEVADSLAGGITNCPQCAAATKVEGLRDPLWRLIQIGAGLLCIVAVFASVPSLGPVLAVALGAGIAIVLWLLSRAL